MNFFYIPSWINARSIFNVNGAHYLIITRIDMMNMSKKTTYNATGGKPMNLQWTTRKPSHHRKGYSRPQNNIIHSTPAVLEVVWQAIFWLGAILWRNGIPTSCVVGVYTQVQRNGYHHILQQHKSKLKKWKRNDIYRGQKFLTWDRRKKMRRSRSTLAWPQPSSFKSSRCGKNIRQLNTSKNQFKMARVPC